MVDADGIPSVDGRHWAGCVSVIGWSWGWLAQSMLGVEGRHEVGRWSVAHVVLEGEAGGHGVGIGVDVSVCPAGRWSPGYARGVV